MKLKEYRQTLCGDVQGEKPKTTSLITSLHLAAGVLSSTVDL